MCAALLILISFGGRFFFRRLCIFLLFSSALGGFFYLFSGYIRLNLPVFLLMGAFFTVVLRKGFSGTFGKSPPVTKIKLFFNGCYTSFQALCDTGNQLLDPLTGRPVLIVEWNSISSLFPSEIKNHITCRSFRSPEEILTYFNQFFPGSFFLIPFQCVGSEHGLLLAFRSERILSDKKRVPVTVAITGTTLGTDCEYSALTSMDA